MGGCKSVNEFKVWTVEKLLIRVLVYRDEVHVPIGTPADAMLVDSLLIERVRNP